MVAVWANFMPKIGPENLDAKVLVDGFSAVIGVALFPVLLVSLYKSLSNSIAAGLAIIVKFCKDKGANATLKRYPRTQIVQDFIVKD